MWIKYRSIGVWNVFVLDRFYVLLWSQMTRYKIYHWLRRATVTQRPYNAKCSAVNHSIRIWDCWTTVRLLGTKFRLILKQTLFHEVVAFENVVCKMLTMLFCWRRTVLKPSQTDLIHIFTDASTASMELLSDNTGAAQGSFWLWARPMRGGVT